MKTYLFIVSSSFLQFILYKVLHVLKRINAFIQHIVEVERIPEETQDTDTVYMWYTLPFSLMSDLIMNTSNCTEISSNIAK